MYEEIAIGLIVGITAILSTTLTNYFNSKRIKIDNSSQQYQFIKNLEDDISKQNIAIFDKQPSNKFLLSIGSVLGTGNRICWLYYEGIISKNFVMYFKLHLSLVLAICDIVVKFNIKNGIELPEPEYLINFSKEFKIEPMNESYIMGIKKTFLASKSLQMEKINET